MLRPLASAVSLALSAAVRMPAVAQTPPAPMKPLRTLVYALEYSETSRSEEYRLGARVRQRTVGDDP